ncbi:MAG: ParB/RepB/Spo0J family partition protein [Bacilli bacterium]|nr:ParB/RepB/Spo0J family partition protein [Bacilli bacterium]
MAREDLKMNLPKIKLDDMFSTQETRDAEKLGKIVNIKIEDIDDFAEHPFKVLENDEMYELSKSIKENGVLVPAIVRLKDNGRYEMVAGHRRKLASQLADLDSIPCIVKDLDDNEATIIMVDSNMQREKILPSEKAFAYKMKLDAIKEYYENKGKTVYPVGTRYNTGRDLENKVEESRTQIYRYIRLTNLIPKLLELVDNESIGLRPAVELSYLSKDEQEEVLDNIECYSCTPSHAQTIEMRKLSAEDKLNADAIENIMAREKPNQVPRLKLNENKIRNILPKNIQDNKIEEFLLKAIEHYTKFLKNRDRDVR